MKERPILFSAPMVRAILDGRKTMTRRVVKHQPPSYCPYLTRCGGDFRWGWSDGSTVDFAWHPRGNGADMDSMWMRSRYGVPGDRLWVRETFRAYQMGVEAAKGGINGYATHVGYTDGSESKCHNGIVWPNRIVDNDIPAEGFSMPSIFMPRWASRITLEITDVRVQQLQEISEADARDEGAGATTPLHEEWDGDPDQYRKRFRELWDSINGKTHPWANNDWVWVIEFRRKTP